MLTVYAEQQHRFTRHHLGYRNGNPYRSLVPANGTAGEFFAGSDSQPIQYSLQQITCCEDPKISQTLHIDWVNKAWSDPKASSEYVRDESAVKWTHDPPA